MNYLIKVTEEWKISQEKTLPLNVNGIVMR